MSCCRVFRLHWANVLLFMTKSRSSRSGKKVFLVLSFHDVDWQPRRLLGNPRASVWGLLTSERPSRPLLMARSVPNSLITERQCHLIEQFHLVWVRSGRAIWLMYVICNLYGILVQKFPPCSLQDISI